MRGTRASLAGRSMGGVALVIMLGLALLSVASACSKPLESKAQAAADVPATVPREATPATPATVEPTAAIAVVQADEVSSPGTEVSESPSALPVDTGVATESEPASPTSVVASAAPTAPTETAALPRLVDLGANKCIPCKKMAPILEELAETHKAFFKVEVIDVWVNPDRGKEYNVRIIPTQIFYDAQGKERYRHIGFYSKEDILSKWRELGVDVGS
jgi:thioredoxin 1